jgi:rhodanese-related sulfurtransferase
MLVDEANTIVDTISVDEAQKYINNDNYIFVDIRDFRELKKEGKIPGAFSCPRGMLEFWIDPNSPYHKDFFNHDFHFIFYCASDWRSALSTETANNIGLLNTSHMLGGFSRWVELNGPIEPPK